MGISKWEVQLQLTTERKTLL